MSRARSRPHHELAQQLDLARRERGLSSRELADTLSCDPRTIRRYLSGDRRPNRQLVELWEQTCQVEPGTLTVFYDRTANGARSDAQPQAAHEPPATTEPSDSSLLANPRTRSPSLVATAAIAVLLAAVVLVLVLRPFSGSDPDLVTREEPRRSDISHHFKPSYTGTVWLRISPTRAHVGQDHRVRLRWGPKENAFVAKRLGPESRTFRLQKSGRDDVTFLVKADPPARVDFGEGEPPDSDARDVPSGWKARTSG